MLLNGLQIVYLIFIVFIYLRNYIPIKMANLHNIHVACAKLYGIQTWHFPKIYYQKDRIMMLSVRVYRDFLYF